MKASRRLWIGLSLAALLCGTPGAQEHYPSRPVEVIVPWGPGGGADVLGRILSRWLETDLKASFPVSNMPGASGMIGLGRMVNQPADGQTLAILTGDSLMMAATPSPSFKFNDALTLAVLVKQPSGIFAPKNSRFKTWQDVVREAQAKPGTVTLAITGPNTADDLTAQYLASKKVALIGIPYTKPGERYASVIGGHVELLYEQAGDVRSFLEAGQLQPLLFFASQRLPAPFADVPVSAEFGYEVLLPQVRAVLVKAGTDPQRLQILNASIERFAHSSDYLKFIDQQMAVPDSFVPVRQAHPYLLSELEALRKLVAQYGAK
jgi:tripartite-type tricarboxylate transporter receptor subunit TctC